MDNQPTIGAKPAEGFTGKNAAENKIYRYDETGRMIDSYGVSHPAFDKTANADLTNTSARIGDYVIQNGQPVAVPNSPTDLIQKYKIAVGGTESPSYNPSLSVEGGGAATGAAVGASILGIVGGPLGAGIGAAIGALGGSLSAHNAAAEEALKNWQKENVKYDTAVEFYRDENGALKYKLDYQKMGTGGPRSGEGVKEAQNRETEVALGDDGRLKVTVSPIFASTARFQELVEWISENYAGLTKDTDNYEQIIKELKDGIDGEANSYITNMKLYAEYANKFPEASPESIVSAYMTEVAGYVDPGKMSEYEMTIVGENGLETKTAKDFFDSVYNMNKDDRNRLLERLYNIVYGEESEYGDNEKSVAFGEMRALYAVSQNPEGYENDKYQGMLDADFFVTVLANFRPLGLNVGDVVHFISGGNLMSTKQEFLNQNDRARFIGLVGSVGASYGLFRGGTALIEKGLKLLPGTSQLFNASLEGQAGGGIATFLQEAEALGGANASGAVSTAAAASAAFKTIKIGIFDAALAGTKTLVSGTDFLTEFGQDFARDAILELVFSYYDMIQFEKAVNDSTVYVYKDPKTGNITIAPEYRERIFENAPEEEIDDLIEIPTYNEAGERIGAEYATKTTKTGGTSVYTPIGVRNIQKTRSGDIVGIAQSEIGTTYYYNGMAVTVTPDGETQKFLLGPDGTVDGIMDLRTGVADVKTTESTTLEGSLAQLGIPSDSIDIFSVPSQNAAAAQVASKIAKFDSSKVGLAINKNLFNKNAVLDTANEIALAKTADLTAWQNRSQKFVSVTDNANQEKNLIKMGTYTPSAKKAFEEYQSLLGELNLTQRYSRADADYLKAIVQLERAAYLDRHKLEGETRNYTAEALEKYGEAIAKIPDDRAEVLKDFLQKRKNRNDAIKLSAKKSGKIDNKKLEDFTDSDLQKEIGWVPQWGKRQTYLGLLDKFYGVSQERNIYKAWLPDGGWIDLDKLEDPIVADDRFLSFITTNMGITDMISSAAEAFNDAGLLVDNTPTSATIRKKKLESIKNKDELKKKLDEMVEAKKKEVKEKVPSQKQYKEMMENVVEDSGILKAIGGIINEKKNVSYDDFRVNENGVKVKKVPIGEYEVELDYTIADRISELNKAGYRTYNSHSGISTEHESSSNAGGGYIQFDGTIDDKKIEAIHDAAKEAGMGFKGEDNPFYGSTITVRQSNTADGLMLEDVIKMANTETIKKYKLPQKNWVDAASEKGKLTEVLDYRDAAAKRIYEKHGGYAQPDDTARNESWDKFFSALGIESKEKPQMIIDSAETMLNEAAKYNNLFGYGFDVVSYLNTSFLPNLKEAINAKDMSMATAVVNQAVLDVAPYRSRSEVLKSQQDEVAQEWREWAEKHIKAGRASSKELKKFADDNNLELPKDKRPLPSKIKHALWEKIQAGKRLPKIEGLDSEKISKNIDKESFYKMLDETPLFQSAIKDKKELVDLIAAEINGETIDAYEMGASTTALGLGGRYPITWYRKGKPYTRFLTYRNAEEQRLAEETVNLFTDKQLVKEPGIISKIASMAANDFRQLTTALDPTRAPLNFARDTGRGQVTSGGQSFINPSTLFKKLLEVGDYTVEEKEKLSQALDNVAEMVAGETYNAAYRSPRKTTVQATKEYLSKTGANPLRRFTYNFVHDKRGLLEKPADFFEGLTRKRLAKSAAVVKLGQLQKEGASFEEKLKGITDAAFFAGREYTANFQRKGKLIGTTSKYIAYQSSAYAGFDGLKRAFINNPKAVSKNFAMFLIAYLILLADTLGDEGSRKNYYRLSEYDRGNSVVISLGDDTVLTIPLDQEIAGLLFPYRRFLETLNGVDPVSFFELMWGTITEPLPLDLSGFTEGEGFNLARGLEKLTAQNMPNVITPIQEAASGYDLYYGSDLRVTDETLKDYGIYNPEAGDYTTAGKNSALLRRIANMTGIPQWQLQAMVDGYGGNVGSYVLNILDKLNGATEEAQGGKDFANAIFKSFVATDQDAASSAFYDGIKKLQQEKKKVIQQVANYNEDIKTATGSAKVELQNKLQKAKDDYATKVGDFVDKYISAYEITGGLPKSQAMQVYYLFRFDDDDTVYQTGSPEEYYNNQALQRFKNQATAMSAPILDKYYNNRIGNIYQNADGEWVRYLSSGAQAMRNSIYSQGEEHMVNLLNIIEGKGSNLKTLRTKVKKAREEAFKAKDYTTRDQLGYDFDLKVVEAISPYIEKYGAENVLGTSDVLDYLSDWFFVPDDFKRTKRGGYVSLGHNASTEEAFVRPYIKYLFGLPTNYYTYSETSLTSPSLGDFER